MELKYTEVAPLRYSQCRAWLVQYDAGGRDVLLTGPSMDVEEVIHMVRNHTHDDFTVGNITVGMLPVHPDWGKPYGGEIPSHLQHFYQLYFNDGRKVDSDGMVQL